MTKHSKLPNKALKRTLIVSVLLALSSLFLLFIITKPKESQETVEYEAIIISVQLIFHLT